MTWLDITQVGLELVLASLAWLVTGRERAHRAFAWLVTYFVTSDLARLVIRWHLTPLPRPFHGWNRILMHADVLLHLGWYALLTAVAVHYFLRRRTWPVAAVAAFPGVFCLDYPRVSGALLQNWYRFVTVLALVAAWSVILIGTARRRFGKPVFAHATMAVLAIAEIVTFARVLARDAVRDWWIVQYAAIGTVVGLIVAHVGWLIAHRADARGTT